MLDKTTFDKKDFKNLYNTKFVSNVALPKACNIYLDSKQPIKVLVISLIHKGFQEIVIDEMQLIGSLSGENEAKGYYSNVLIIKIDANMKDVSSFINQMPELFKEPVICTINIIEDSTVFLAKLDDPNLDLNNIGFDALYSFERFNPFTSKKVGS